MSVREWLNNNSQMTMGLAVVVLLAALVVVAMQFRSAGPRTALDVYFWDMQANQAFVHPGNAIPPVEAPSGGEGVRAHLYTCGECTPDEWFGYLEKYTDRAKQHHEQTGDIPAEDEQRVRALDGERWMAYYSREGQRIIDAIYAVYDDEHAAPCNQPGVPPRQCLP